MGQGCPFCGVSETIFYIFLECSRLQMILQLVEGWVSAFGFLFTNVLLQTESCNVLVIGFVEYFFCSIFFVVVCFIFIFFFYIFELCLYIFVIFFL